MTDSNKDKFNSILKASVKDADREVSDRMQLLPGEDYFERNKTFLSKLYKLEREHKDELSKYSKPFNKLINHFSVKKIKDGIEYTFHPKSPLKAKLREEIIELIGRVYEENLERR